LGPAQPRGVAWNGAGGCEIFSQARQVNFSRTVWITFHWRGTASSVSVTSSPIFDSLSEPQHAQAVGGGTTTRSRGICAGNGLRAGLRRVNPLTSVVSAAAFSAASSSSVALASSSSSWSSNWSRRRCLRSERWPWISRWSFLIVSFRKAISAAASDTFASAFAARASASVAFASALDASASAFDALASAAASAVFRAAMLVPSGIDGIESQRPIRRHNNPRDRAARPPISPRVPVASCEPGSANRSLQANSRAVPR